MSKGLVLLGDKTYHGGIIISASANFTVTGIKVALVGDLVSCPVEGHETDQLKNDHQIVLPMHVLLLSTALNISAAVV